MPTTTNYGWTTPADTDLVKDGASAIRTLGTAIDTTVFNNAGAAIAKTIVDAKGDLIVATAADTVARLAVGGTNGHVLQVDSSTATGLKWDAVVAGGMTLINTGGTTLTGASVTIGTIPSTYKNLQLLVVNYKPANDGAALMLRFNSDSGANRYFTNELFGKPAAITFNSTEIYVSEGSDNTDAQGILRLDIPDYANATTWKYLTSFGITNSHTTSTQARSNMTSGGYNQTGAITGITLLPSSGNFTSGTAYLYGVS